MSLELHYTSVARGLKPGSRGFGTVAATSDEHLGERVTDAELALELERRGEVISGDLQTRRHRTARGRGIGIGHDLELRRACRNGGR